MLMQVLVFSECLRVLAALCHYRHSPAFGRRHHLARGPRHGHRSFDRACLRVAGNGHHEEKAKKSFEGSIGESS